MKWRDEVPLSEADYAAIRRNVMASVRVPVARRPPIWQFAFAAAAMIAIAFLTIRAPVKDTRQPPITAPRQARTVVVHTEPQSPRAPAMVVARKQHHHRARPRKSEMQTAAMRIDIQTADPNVRIIWFAR